MVKWDNAMRKNHEPGKSDLSWAAKQGFDRFIPGPEPEPNRTTRMSTDGGWGQRSTGKWMSGLMMFGLLAMTFLASPMASRAASIAVGISVGIAPPPIPVYAQPVCPGPGYMWTPGYWAYDPANGYYWVPGTWVVAPAPGLLWTPGYWGWVGSGFIFHAGYWGPHIGFYGGINYGFGYPGVGFVGGEWRGGSFFYNRSVVNVGAGHFANVYYRPVATHFSGSRVSYNGGVGGINARPTPGEFAAQRDRHLEATSLQQQHEMAAHNDRAQFASTNHGRPDVAATGRAGEFRGAGVVRASQPGGTAAGYHGTYTGHTNTYSGTHSPNPGGGGTHQVMTPHSNPAYSQSSGTRQGGTGGGGFHSTPPSHNEMSRGGTPTHNAPSHQTQQHGSHNSGGGRS